MNTRDQRDNENTGDRLQRAMELFWRQGYYDTSVSDLVAETGANRYGLYGEYGSKQGLFRETLRVYGREVTARMTAVMSGPDASLAEIRAFFAQFLEILETPRGQMGCLVCNTATEVSDQDADIAADIADVLASQRGLFHAAFVKARDRGEIAASADPEILADHCVGSLMGFMGYARSPAPREAVRNHVKGILGFLDAIAQHPQ
jgi:AcrR family transcriptional regulator